MTSEAKIRPSKCIKKAWRADCASGGSLSLRAFARKLAAEGSVIATAWLDSKAKQ